jgi:hypothetical protein
MMLVGQTGSSRQLELDCLEDRCSPTGDRGFESCSLQRRVSCEPEAGLVARRKKRESSRRRICGLLNSFRARPFSAWPVSAAVAEVVLLAAQEFDQCQIGARQVGMGTPNNQSKIPRPIFPPVQGRETRPVNFAFAVISSLYPGLCHWRRQRRSAPSLFSAAPSACVLASPDTLPTVSFTAPFT